MYLKTNFLQVITLGGLSPKGTGKEYVYYTNSYVPVRPDGLHRTYSKEKGLNSFQKGIMNWNIVGENRKSGG